MAGSKRKRKKKEKKAPRLPAPQRPKWHSSSRAETPIYAVLPAVMTTPVIKPSSMWYVVEDWQKSKTGE